MCENNRFMPFETIFNVWISNFNIYTTLFTNSLPFNLISAELQAVLSQHKVRLDFPFSFEATIV